MAPPCFIFLHRSGVLSRPAGLEIYFPLPSESQEKRWFDQYISLCIKTKGLQRKCKRIKDKTSSYKKKMLFEIVFKYIMCTEVKEHLKSDNFC